MADLTPQELAAKLHVERFKPSGPELATASDPIAETAMVVTLDELRPYELNPRIVRNPRYDDIKASIRARGLEAPLPITRRPGESHYIIRNGGNTRLAILNELWKETRNEQFFRTTCLFRPWTAEGEILALTGHLAENELRGTLTFIERALGVEKARELYEREGGEPLTQAELSERLKQHGYPVAQSHISRMQDAIRYLLPAIPKILFGGLGKHQIERLIALRRGAQRIFERHATKKAVDVDFDALFQDVSAAFDLEPATFSVQRLQDELIGQMANLFGADYDALMLALVDAEAWQQSLLREPAAQIETTSAVAAATSPEASRSPQPPPSASARLALATEPEAFAPSKAGAVSRDSSASQAALRPSAAPANEIGKRTVQSDVTAHQAATPVEKTRRVQAIEKQLTEATGDREPPKLESEARRAVTRQSEPQSFSDLWDITPSLRDPQHLREHIGGLARDIAHEADIAPLIEAVEEGIGFVCHSPKSGGAQPAADSIGARAILSLLSSLSSGYMPRRPTVDGVRLIDDLAPLLQGTFPNLRAHSAAMRLSDEGLLKLFRLIRLARGLVDLESARARHPDPSRDHR